MPHRVICYYCRPSSNSLPQAVDVDRRSFNTIFNVFILILLLYTFQSTQSGNFHCWKNSLLFLLYIADLPMLLQNELVGYVDDSTLLCRIPHPRDRSSVAASLNDDLTVISDWCSRWGMLVNPSIGPHTLWQDGIIRVGYWWLHCHCACSRQEEAQKTV